MASEKIQGILDTVGGLSVLELNELVKELQEQWGVTAAVAGPAASTGTTDTGPAVEDEVQTEFDVILKDVGAQKIQVIKAIREVQPTLGLKEAKEVADNAPKAVAEGVSKEDAEKMKEKLEAAGASVELK